jgi:hypothetical protein
MVTSITEGGTQKLPKRVRLSKHTDVTIHWKALEKHFLMVPLIFQFNYWWGRGDGLHFLKYLQSVII